MKKRVLSILIVILLTVAVLGTATAEGNAAGQSNQTLHIESLKNASYEELEAARQQIIREQRARIKAYILLDQTDLRIAKGTSAQLSATVEDLLDDLTCEPLTWSTTDESIATVSKTGQIKAIAPGEAEIVCATKLSDETELTATCKVTVYVQVSKVGAENKALNITKGQTEQIVPVIVPDDVTDPSVTYESSDPAIATVSADGLVKAVSVGPFSITVTAKDGSEKNLIIKGKVLQDVEAVVFEKKELSIPVGKKAAVKTTLQPENPANKNLTWTVDDEAVAIVDAKGQITAVAKGTTMLHAEAVDGNGAKAECKIIVVDPVKTINLSEKNLNMIATVNKQLTAEVLPEDATNREIVWSSSNEKIATVDQTGLIKPIAKGACVITAEATDGSGVKAQAKVAVKQYDVVFLDSNPITVSYDPIEMTAGMLMINYGSRNNRIDVSGGHGKLTISPLAAGEDIATIEEYEYFSGDTVKESWTVYVLPEAIGE